MGYPEQVIFNFSGVYIDEGMTDSIKGGRVLDFATLDGVNCFCDPDGAAAIRSAIRDIPPAGIHWLDSGDYHYATRFWLEKIDRPFSLVLLDHHPDMQESAFADESLMSCGGWVGAALRDLPMLRKVLLVGTAPSLLEYPLPQNCRAVPEGSSVLPEDIQWLDNDLPVYFSIDKDVLSEDYASTDWDQGSMTMEQLASVLSSVAQAHSIIGADVCGELPARKGGTESDFELNSRTNLALVSILQESINLLNLQDNSKTLYGR